MRTFVMSIVMGLVVLAWSGMARTQEASANSGAAVANNMQWHNGHWWFYNSNGQWLVHHDNQWFAPGPDGQYRYSDGRLIFNAQAQASTGVRYQSGYRSNPNYNYGNTYYDRYGNPYYGNNAYGNRYGTYGYGNSRYGNNYGYGNPYYGGNQGSNVGAAIGGALGGSQGAAAGAIIGGAINR